MFGYWFSELIKTLNELNINVKFIATDGDISFDYHHHDFIDKHFLVLIDEPFNEIVMKLFELSKIPLNDPFHALFHLLMTDPDGCRCLNMKLFEQIANFGPVFFDINKAGAMKDSYALSMFFWSTFVSVLNGGRFDAAFFVLPYLF